MPDFAVIAGVSLGNTATLRFRPYPTNGAAKRHAVQLEVAPPSIYKMSGAARWAWQHCAASGRTPLVAHMSDAAPTVKYRSGALHDTIRPGGRPPARIANWCGRIQVVWLHVEWFGRWIAFNSLPGLPHFDPYPFTLLVLAFRYRQRVGPHPAATCWCSSGRAGPRFHIAHRYPYLPEANA